MMTLRTLKKGQARRIRSHAKAQSAQGKAIDIIRFAIFAPLRDNYPYPIAFLGKIAGIRRKKTKGFYALLSISWLEMLILNAKIQNIPELQAIRANKIM